METILRQIKAVETSKPNKSSPRATTPKKRKDTIPVALREAIWLHHMGRHFEGKCMTTWCKNTITVFDFQSGHDQPESKGGPTTFENLVPICARCNLSMGNRFTFAEWCKLSEKTIPPPPTTKKIQTANPMRQNVVTSPLPVQTSVPEVETKKSCFSCW
jgi:5-methylcytosine-specific restriction endonuclease McrA